MTKQYSMKPKFLKAGKPFCNRCNTQIGVERVTWDGKAFCATCINILGGDNCFKTYPIPLDQMHKWEKEYNDSK